MEEGTQEIRNYLRASLVKAIEEKYIINVLSVMEE